MLKSLIDLLINKGLFLLLFAVPLFYTSPLSPSPLINDAHPSRLAEVHMLYERALGQQGWISGWDQRFQCGYPVGIYQYQTGPLLIAALTGLTGMALASSYKIIMFLLCLFAIFMVWRFLLRWVTRGVAMAATMALFLGAGYIEQMAQGFWNCAISLGFLALFLDGLYREDMLNLRNASRLILVYALIVMTHQYAAIAAGVLMLGRLPSLLRAGGLRNLAWWCAIPIGAVLATLVYVYPIIETRHWLMAAEDGAYLGLDTLAFGFLHFTSLEFVESLLAGLGPVAVMKKFIVSWPNLAAEVLALSLIVHWRAGRLSPREKRLVSGLSIAFAVFAVINLKLVAFVPIDRLREIAGHIVSYRFKLFGDFALFPLAALGLHHWNRLYLNPQTESFRKLKIRLRPAAVNLCVIIILGLTTLLGWYRMATHHRYNTFADIPQHQKDLLATWQWFREADRGPYRVLFESTYQNFLTGENDERLALKQSTITALGALYSGMPQTSGVYNAVLPMHHLTRTANGHLMGMDLDNPDPDIIFHRLWACNIGYFITCSERCRQFMDASPAMKILDRHGPFTIYRYLDAPGNWAWSEGGETVAFRFDPENDARMHAAFSNPAPGNRLHVSVSWHPYWRATLDGQPLALEPDADGMIMALIDKTGPVEVDYMFSSRNLPGPIPAVNALFLTGLIIMVARGRFRPSTRRRKRPA